MADGGNVNGDGLAVGPSGLIPPQILNAYQGEEWDIRANLARRAGVRVLYESIDITRDIAPWLLGLEYTDGMGRADDLQISLWDDGRWRTSWSPDKGAKLTVDIFALDQGQAMRLPCGTFSIDEIEYSGPPDTVSIKGVSAWISTALRTEKKTRAWEKISLQGIAQTIASKAGLTLDFSGNNPTYTRVDQKSRSDLDFLTEICEREGCWLKVTNGKLIIYPDEEWQSAPAVAAFTKNGGFVLGYSFRESLTGGYNKIVISWHDPKAKKLIQVAHIPKNAPETGQVLRKNIRCGSIAEAKRIAPNILDRANRSIQEASLDVIGDVRISAGMNVDIAGWGSVIDGRYEIGEPRHSLWPYATSMDLRKI